MQQRGSNTTMENDDENHSSIPLSRGRNSAKLKVLVRSHAMREETSPPRAPSPGGCPHHHHQQQLPPLQPRIELTPSPEAGAAARPPAVAAPAGGAPSPVHCPSPASTLVATPASRCSPLCASHEGELNSPQSPDSDQSSHASIRKKYCDCHHPNCINCAMQQRNINNNLANLGSKGAPGSPNRLSVSRTGPRGKLRQQSSSQSSFEVSSTTSPSLSRDNSSEQYTDTTGVDLEQFIPETLNRNAKDRALMLRIEQELVSLAKDKNKTHYKFPPMSSYQRMLVHRCAAYFGMDHNIEPSGKCVVVNKTKNTRIPEIEFKEHIKEDIIFSEEPRRSILKRDSNSIEDYSFKSPDRSYGMENRRSKSFEEREEEYEKARRRIFNREMQDGSAEDFVWSEVPWSSTDSDYSSKFRLHPPELHTKHYRKLLKVQSEEMCETNRPYVAKSYSFGGYGGNVSVLNRGDSVMSTHSAGPRLLTKQDSGASSVSWRLSPSSSGYKSQSQMSESITPSPTSTPNPMGDSRQDSNSSGENQDSVIMDRTENHIVWAVTDIHNVPKGSIIINPQTGKPIKNNDGSMYHYDPMNPPPGLIPTPPPPKSPSSPQKPNSKEQYSSAKPKCSIKTSPIRKSNVTNSATSPSLPFSPPLPTSVIKNFSQGPPEDNPPSIQQFPVYSSSYPSSTADSNIPIYQPPCLFYTSPYGLPVHQQYDGRMDQHPPLPEITSTYYIQETAGPPPAPSITYQQQPSGPFWNQQPIPFYQNNAQTQNPTPPHRFPVPLQTAQSQAGYMQAAGYPPNYIQQHTTVTPQNTTTELIPVFPNQAVQMVYNQTSVPNAVLYQNQPPIIYAQNTVFPTPAYPSQNAIPSLPPHYPQTTQTPNGCTSAPNPQFANTEQAQNFVHLAQNMQQLSLAHHGQGNLQRAFLGAKCQQPFEMRPKPTFPKRNSYATPSKGFIMGSSQSSTGTNSPAATIIAGYCPQNAGMYKTPPSTPPAAQFATFPLNLNVPPILFRQISNTSVGTASRTSRSPTPASDISHLERQHIPLPPNIYQGTPYVIQSDTRVFAGRGQPSTYRQPTPPTKQPTQAPEFRSHGKGRKFK